MTQGVQRKGARVALTELPRGLVPKACLHICLTLHTPLHASLTGSLKARPLLEWSLYSVFKELSWVLGYGDTLHPGFIASFLHPLLMLHFLPRFILKQTKMGTSAWLRK